MVEASPRPAPGAEDRALEHTLFEVTADPLVLNRGRFFDRQGRHMEVSLLSS